MEKRGGAGVLETGAKAARFVKVDTQKLDNMVDMVGELVITQAMLAQVMSGFVGKQEIVIKSLGEQLQGVRGMAGRAIPEDGCVGLILDVPGVFEISENRS